MQRANPQRAYKRVVRVPTDGRCPRHAARGEAVAYDVQPDGTARLRERERPAAERSTITHRWPSTEEDDFA